MTVTMMRARCDPSAPPKSASKARSLNVRDLFNPTFGGHKMDTANTTAKTSLHRIHKAAETSIHGQSHTATNMMVMKACTQTKMVSTKSALACSQTKSPSAKSAFALGSSVSYVYLATPGLVADSTSACV